MKNGIITVVIRNSVSKSLVLVPGAEGGSWEGLLLRVFLVKIFVWFWAYVQRRKRQVVGYYEGERWLK